jgi:hypothetical protein
VLIPKQTFTQTENLFFDYMIKTVLMKLNIAKSLFFLLPFFTACRTITAHKVSRLPENLYESSGLIAESAHRFWSHNDSGDEPSIYQFDEKGILLKKINISNATNVDWEEMQMDNQGNLYIADFGNNAHSRKDLVIYKITDFKNKTAEVSIKAERIEFHYDEQKAFPPSEAERHFDAEAFVVLNDSILIFTKDFTSKPYSGKTSVYKIPNQIGKHTAKLVTVLETNKKGKYKGAITAAAMSPNQNQIVLMSYQKLWVFKANQPFEQIFSAKKKNPVFTFGLTQFAQREAVAFADGCTLYITSERLKKRLGGNLSKVDICRYLKDYNDFLR